MQNWIKKIFIMVILVTGFVMITAGMAAYYAKSSPNQAVNVPDVPTGRIDSGTFFFQRHGFDPDQRMWILMADDHDAYPLAEGVEGEPSRQLHADNYWFLTTRRSAETVDSKRGERYELFAVREDGHAVQLTHDPELEPLSLSARWIPGSDDRRISWIARRWGPGGEVVEGGIYEAVVVFNEEDEIIGLSGTPRQPCLMRDLVRSYCGDSRSEARVPNIRSHDWSPDGQSVVYDSLDDQVFIVDLRTRRSVVVDKPACDPVWSPDGATIAFKMIKPYGEIATIRPDGTGLTVLIDPGNTSRRFNAAMPIWAPDGRQIIYQRSACEVTPFEMPCEMDAITVTPENKDPINLTGMVPGFVYPVAWR